MNQNPVLLVPQEKKGEFPEKMEERDRPAGPKCPANNKGGKEKKEPEQSCTPLKKTEPGRRNTTGTHNKPKFERIKRRMTTRLSWKAKKTGEEPRKALDLRHGLGK